MEWYLEAWRRCGVTDGRARRLEFWNFLLVHWLAFFLLSLLDKALGLDEIGLGYGIVSILYALAALCPTFCLLARRLHDADLSAGWVFVAFVPLLGLLATLVYGALPGTPGPNRFGPDPKAMPPSAPAVE